MAAIPLIVALTLGFRRLNLLLPVFCGVSVPLPENAARGPHSDPNQLSVEAETAFPGQLPPPSFGSRFCVFLRQAVTVGWSTHRLGSPQPGAGR